MKLTPTPLSIFQRNKLAADPVLKTEILDQENRVKLEKRIEKQMKLEGQETKKEKDLKDKKAKEDLEGKRVKEDLETKNQKDQEEMKAKGDHADKMVIEDLEMRKELKEEDKVQEDKATSTTSQKSNGPRSALSSLERKIST